MRLLSEDTLVTKPNLAVLDMDGVLVDFMKGSFEVHGVTKTYDEVYEGNMGEWDFLKLLGLTPPNFWKPMNEEFWAKLDWTEDGEDIFRMVERKFGLNNIVIMTSPSSNYGCHDGKLRWMERHLPRRLSKSGGHVFGSPKHLLSNPRHVLIDDRDLNVDTFREYNGGLVVEVPRISNRHHPIRHRTREYIAERLAEI